MSSNSDLSAATASHPYWCFISYRHADNKEEGRQWATWLHQAIETYEVPEDLVGVVNDRGDTIPERIFPVFRDEEELPADAHLASPIYRALDRSRFLVVLCSPRAVASTYVDDEIRYFKKQGGADRILAALLEGEPNASWDTGKHASGVARERECFPRALQHPVDAEGGLITTERAEPIAADFRLGESGQQGWTTPEAYRRALVAERNLSSTVIAARVANYRRQCDLAKLKIIAGILGIPLGKLTRRDAAYQLAAAKRRARVLRRWLAAVGLLAVLATAGGAIAWRQKQIALAQEQEATTQRGRAQQRAAEALEANRKYREQLHEASMGDWVRAKGLLETSKWPEGIAYLGRALRYEPENRVATGWLWSEIIYGWGTPPYSRNGRDHLPERLLVHESTVNGVAYSPDGTRLVTACEDGTARFWDTATAQATGMLLKHEEPVKSVAFNADGSRVLTVSGQSARFWDAASGQPIGEPMRHDCPLASAVFNPAGTRVLTFFPEDRDRMTTLGEARLWDVATGQPVGSLLRHGVNTARPLSAAPAPPELYGSVGDRKALVPEEGLSRAFFSPDGARLLTVSRGKLARLWDGTTGEPIAALTLPNPVTHASFSRDGTCVVLAAGEDAQSWDAATGKLLGPVPYSDWRKAVSDASNIALNADGSRALRVSEAGEAEVWETKFDTLYGEAMRHALPIVSAAFSPDGKRGATACRDRIVRIWSIGPKPVRPEALQHFYPAVTALNPTAERLVTATVSGCFGGGGQLAVWDLKTGRRTPEVLGYDPSLTDPVLSRDQTRILFSGSAKSPEAYLFDVQNRKWLGAPLRHESPVQNAAFSPDATRVATVSSDTIVRCWNASSGELMGAPLHHDAPVLAVAFSPDGSRIITSTGTQIFEWDAATGEPRALKDGDPFARLRHLGDEAATAVLSPDGRLVLTVRKDGGPRLWDAATALPMRQPWEYAANLATFSPDGRRIVTLTDTSGLGSAQVWECIPALSLPPPWLEPFIEALAGSRFDEQGGLQPLTVVERVSRRQAVLAAVKASAGRQSEWDSLAQWVFASPDQRKMTPGSDLTVLQVVERVVANSLAVTEAQNAAAKLPRIFRPDADYWAKSADSRIQAQRPSALESALEEAEKAISLAPQHYQAWKAKCRALQGLQRYQEALNGYIILLSLPEAKAGDFTNAGYLAALWGFGDVAKIFFTDATERFPKEESIPRIEGWALLNLKMPEEALAAFRSSEALIVAAQKKPGPDVLAGVVIASWMNKQSEVAIQECRRLIGLDPKYADAAKIRVFAWSAAEVESMLAVLAETLRRHPELAPRPSQPN